MRVSEITGQTYESRKAPRFKPCGLLLGRDEALAVFFAVTFRKKRSGALLRGESLKINILRTFRQK